MVVYWSRRRITLSHRCNNVAFQTLLLQPKTNVVTTLCFSTSVFRPGVNVAATLWFWCRFLDENLKCVPISLQFYFSKDMQYCLAIPFFDKQNLFCMCQCKAFAQMVDIWKFGACCLSREKRFLILCSSMIRNSSLFSGGKFGRVVI